MSFPPDAPQPDALDQSTPVADEEDGTDEATESPASTRDSEVPEADALDQEREVPLEDDWDR